MVEWQVRPRLRTGWAVLTPFRTQAAVERTRREAIARAERMIADEGGGRLVVDPYRIRRETRTVLPCRRPYQPGPDTRLYQAMSGT